MPHVDSIARLLLKIGAVQFNTESPFQFSSGLLSPIYCDTRRLFQNVKGRRTVIRSWLKKLINNNDIKIDCIAGVATSAIPHGAWLAEALGKPFVFARSQPKGHGLEKIVEGGAVERAHTLVVEDVVTTGHSLFNVVQNLRNEGAIVTYCLSIVSYGFPKTAELFQKNRLSLLSLTDFHDLLKTARNLKRLSITEILEVEKWFQNPAEWKKIE